MKFRKCPNCKAVLSTIKIRKHNNRAIKGRERISYCPMCDETYRSFIPFGQWSETFVPTNHKLTQCGDCGHIASHFETIHVMGRTGILTPVELAMCDECYSLRDQPAEVYEPKVKPPRQIKYICGDVVGWNYN